MQSNLARIAAAVASLLFSVTATCDKTLLPELTFTLNGANVEWPNSFIKNIFTSSDRYTPKNILATRIQIYRDEAFVLTPRYKPGVPFTLGKFSLKNKNCHPTIAPYPCWDLQEEGNCQAIQSAVDIFLDSQDILWILDSGIVNTLDQPIKRYLSGLVCSASRLQYLVVDYAADGRSFLYISDAATHAILVYDITNSRGYRVVLPKIVTRGCSTRDVLYIALIRKSEGNTELYLTYLSGESIFSVKTEYLRRGSTKGSVTNIGPKHNDIIILGTDNGYSLFFRLKGESDIYMWNTETCFKSENFMLVQKGNECHLATQVVPGYRRLMWVLESNFHDYIQDKVSCTGASVSLHPLVKTCDA
ncbi:hypothetical protein L9F63_005799 [Diploptera punctata]|uniref:Bee-milk protein n=1 Tax=Diploptera punctata TaxID=6984 RepID=A0AAD7ZC63_DIPPU|nr:hypothetical protein L9F63_005799 [Diploptera punctata]